MRNSKRVIPSEMRDEIVSMYLNGENSYEELGEYYKVGPGTIRTWVCRYRKTKKVVSLQSKVKQLEARIRELELQNLALNTLIDVAERNGVEIRKKSGAKQ